ncbi:MAG: efflux RND transporter periplasmic adaptor subunit [Candidatus Zixiibacteriota bacterium]
MNDEPAKSDLSRLRIRRDDPTTPQTAPARRGRSRWLWLIILAAAVAVVAVFWVTRRSAVEVQTTTVSRLAPASAQSLLTATGYVVAQRKAAVASKGTGRLERLNVVEGDQVKAGQVIAQLEATDVTASLAAARAGVNEARANLEQAQAVEHEARLNFERVQELYTKNLVAQSDFDNAQARFETAKAGVAAAQAAIASAQAAADYAAVQVENTYIRAPFDGTVLSKHADVGEVVAPFASSASSRGAVVTLADMTSLQVEADVSESNIRQITLGQPCLITLDALPAEPYRGRVEKIVPTADRSKATVLTKIAFDQIDGRVLPEMSAKVNFLPARSSAEEVSTTTVLAVPRAAVVQRGNRSVVFTVRGGQAFAAAVETGQMFGGTLEIRSGVNAGDVIVATVPEKLQDGDRVTIKQ